MMTIRDLKPGERFVKWDGVRCVLVQKNEGRAVIRVENPPTRKVEFVAHEGSAEEKALEFTSAKREYEVALGTEIMERL
jgi:hypothetical protein